MLSDFQLSVKSKQAITFIGFYYKAVWHWLSSLIGWSLLWFWFYDTLITTSPNGDWVPETSRTFQCVGIQLLGEDHSHGWQILETEP